MQHLAVSLRPVVANTVIQGDNTSMPIVFEDVAPVVPVRDLQAALERYRRLGFEVRAYGHGTGYARNVLAIANGMTAEQGVSDRNPPSTRLPAMSWLIRDSLGVHYRFGLLAHAESILQPLLDNHRKLTLCYPVEMSTRRLLLAMNSCLRKRLFLALLFSSLARRNALKRCMLLTTAAWRTASCFSASLISASRL
jgi:hypothetical protein